MDMLGDAATLATAFSINPSDIEIELGNITNWNIHQSCKAVKFKNYVAAYVEGAWEFFSGTTHAIMAIDQQFKFVVAQDVTDPNATNKLFRLKWSDRSFV